MATLKVTLGKKTREVTWAGPSELAGDQIAVDLLEITAEAREGQPIGPAGGPVIEEDYLETPLGFYLLALAVFDQVEADWDPWEDVNAEAATAPEDAVF